MGRGVLEELYGVLRAGGSLEPRDVRAAIQAVTALPGTSLRELYSDVLASVGGRRRITAKNLSQRRYIELIDEHDLVFAIGPAGTGKTYLAMAMAIAALQRREVVRVILTRPAVEAGERLGFLPGTLAEKVNPYLRPLYDALHDMMDFDKAQRLIERGTIEVAPLAFMRGRTLNDSFVILDEAQNTIARADEDVPHPARLSSKAVVTGDITQIDLPTGQALRAHRCARGPRRRRGHRHHALHRGRRGAPSAGAVDRPRLRAPRRRSGATRTTAADERSRVGAAARHEGAAARACAGASRASCWRRSASPRPSSRSRSWTTPTGAALNERWRGRSGPTDVLSFSLAEGAHADHRGAAARRRRDRAGRCAAPGRRARPRPRGRMPAPARAWRSPSARLRPRPAGARRA